jgi:hypothetical protein
VDPEFEKHLEDLHRLHAVVDWRFCAFLLARGRILWLGRNLPRAIDRRIILHMAFVVGQFLLALAGVRRVPLLGLLRVGSGGAAAWELRHGIGASRAA